MSVYTTIVPAGYAIKFQSHRPRGYYILDDPDDMKLVDDKAWGERLDSVTKILGVLDKPALPWWGMEVGIAGVAELIRLNELHIRLDGEFVVLDEAIRDDPEILTDIKRVAKLLTKNKLTVNHVRDTAGDRGQDAHNCFETWCETGILPDPRAWPLESRGYIQAMLKFVSEHEYVSDATEVIVASREHRIGGRYDSHGTLDGTKVRIDVKTSKRVYASHFLQMEGYEGFAVECGYEPTDIRYVIHFKSDGEYDIVSSEQVSKDKEPCNYEDFLAIVRTQRVVNRLGGL